MISTPRSGYCGCGSQQRDSGICELCFSMNEFQVCDAGGDDHLFTHSDEAMSADEDSPEHEYESDIEDLDTEEDEEDVEEAFDEVDTDEYEEDDKGDFEGDFEEESEEESGEESEKEFEEYFEEHFEEDSEEDCEEDSEEDCEKDSEEDFEDEFKEEYEKREELIGKASENVSVEQSGIYGGNCTAFGPGSPTNTAVFSIPRKPVAYRNRAALPQLPPREPNQAPQQQPITQPPQELHQHSPLAHQPQYLHQYQTPYSNQGPNLAKISEEQIGSSNTAHQQKGTIFHIQEKERDKFTIQSRSDTPGNNRVVRSVEVLRKAHKSRKMYQTLGKERILSFQKRMGKGIEGLEKYVGSIDKQRCSDGEAPAGFESNDKICGSIINPDTAIPVIEARRVPRRKMDSKRKGGLLMDKKLQENLPESTQAVANVSRTLLKRPLNSLKATRSLSKAL